MLGFTDQVTLMIANMISTHMYIIGSHDLTDDHMILLMISIIIPTDTNTYQDRPQLQDAQ